MPQEPEPDTSDKTKIDSDQWQGKCVCGGVGGWGGEWGVGGVQCYWRWSQNQGVVDKGSYQWHWGGTSLVKASSDCSDLYSWNQENKVRKSY